MASILERNKNIKPKQKTRAEYAEDALYREVWEEVNNEKSLAFIKKYSKHMISAALAVLIVAVAVQIGVRTYHANKIARAVNYETAVMNLDSNALVAMGKASSGATADLAMFQAYLLKNDVNILEQLANSGHARDFRDLAKMHIVNLRGDEMDAVDVEKYLRDLNTKSSPFYYVSRLVVAQKYLSTGDRKNAQKWLDVIINDKNAPASISATAQTLR